MILPLSIVAKLIPRVEMLENCWLDSLAVLWQNPKYNSHKTGYVTGSISDIVQDSLRKTFKNVVVSECTLDALLLDHCVLLLAFSLTLQPSDAVQPFITLLSRLPVLLQAIDLSRSQSQYRTSGKPPVSKGLPLLLETLQTSHMLCCAVLLIFQISECPLYIATMA
jgi:hypothetical protein